MDWKRNLSSRKFWLALIGFITPLMTSLGMPESDIVNTTKVVMGFGCLIAYILSEGYIDGKSQEGDAYLPDLEDDEDDFEGEE